MGRGSGIAIALAAVFVIAPRPAVAESVCGLEEPEIAELSPLVPDKERASHEAFSVAPVRRDRASLSVVDGALTGKTIYVSPGHGWTWLPSVPGWRTQRGNTHDLVEDLISTETIAYFLIPMLRNMGAYVVPIRESDPNPNLVIADDDDAMSMEGELALTAETVGFATPQFPLTDDTNPFELGGSVTLSATTSATGALVWTLDVPEDGDYNVYVAYVQDPSRAPDAHYAVRHPGGESHFRVDQRRHGSTWVLLGRFYFTRGASPELGSVVLYDDSSEPGTTLSADAVRIGGGTGLIDRGGGAHTRPMYEHNARYNVQLCGAPPSVYAYTGEDRTDDVGSRSRFAAWDHEDGEDAVYVAWHTNAPDPGRGTSSFVYGPTSFGSLSDFSGVPGSLELQAAVHGELVGDLRAIWDEDWTDRGRFIAPFGEVNPNHNPEMPAVLVEVAFHDTAADAASLREPAFRRIAARAIAEGIAGYFAERDGLELVLPPEPPTDVRMIQSDLEALQLSWSPPAADAAGGDPPTRYRVYLSHDGRSYDDGREVAGTSYVITEPVDRAVFARVAAVNTGGESERSALVGGRVARSGQAAVLVVDGFDALDSSLGLRDDLSADALGMVDRMLIDHMNDRSYAARYGAAIDAYGASFDTVSAEAVTSGTIGLAPYRAVIWFAGENAAPVLGDDARAAIDAYLAAGGHLVLSAANLSGATDEAFGAVRAGEATGYDLVTDPAGALGELSGLSFDDFGVGSYDAQTPDALDLAAGAVPLLTYTDGQVAATLLGDQVAVLGFPFETLRGEDARAEVMARLLSTLSVEPEPPPAVPGGCGCRTGQNGRDGLEFLLLAVALLARCRRRK